MFGKEGADMMPTQFEDRRPLKKTGGSPSVPESGVVLPPGYRIHPGLNLMVLRRADGSMVTAFGASGADPAARDAGGLTAADAAQKMGALNTGARLAQSQRD